eukprot:Platyproteum_vivax@DN6740_c0_g1_i1.p3
MRAGMHSDDERHLVGPIASISLGAERIMRFKNKPKSQHVKDMKVSLPHNSLLLMSGTTQLNFKHGVAPQKSILEPRINLTYRCVRTTEANLKSLQSPSKRRKHN